MHRFNHDESAARFDYDLDEFLHPAQAFSHPSEIVSDPDLTLNEKRAILASWASDACAVDSAPALRHGAPGKPPVSFDDVMDALRTLDKLGSRDSEGYRRHERRQRILGRRRQDDGYGSTPLQA